MDRIESLIAQAEEYLQMTINNRDHIKELITLPDGTIDHHYQERLDRLNAVVDRATATVAKTKELRDPPKAPPIPDEVIAKAADQAAAQDDDQLTCDTCGTATDDPWHYSSWACRHLHACDKCWDKVNPVADLKKSADETLLRSLITMSMHQPSLPIGEAISKSLEPITLGSLLARTAKIVSARTAMEQLREQYIDLLQQVEMKVPGENRHATAKRLLKEAQQLGGYQPQGEQPSNPPGAK